MNDCIFCKIASKEIPAEIFYEDENFLAFPDINPKARTHYLIIPKKHIEPVSQLTSDDTAMLGRLIDTARIVAREQGIAESGFRLVINSGPDSGMEVGHLHLHLLGGEKLGDINS